MQYVILPSFPFKTIWNAFLRFIKLETEMFRLHLGLAKRGGTLFSIGCYIHIHQMSCLAFMPLDLQVSLVTIVSPQTQTAPVYSYTVYDTD